MQWHSCEKAILELEFLCTVWPDDDAVKHRKRSPTLKNAEWDRAVSALPYQPSMMCGMSSNMHDIIIVRACRWRSVRTSCIDTLWMRCEPIMLWLNLNYNNVI